MKKSSTKIIFFVMVILAVILPVQTACAHEPPAIVPVRLDFDARQAPKDCNERATFRSFLANWLLPNVLIPDAERQLVVRIRRSPAGGNLVDLTVLDADGTAVAREHKTFPSKTVCHKVLYESAYAAATLLGAFDKPPSPEPVVCPAPLPLPAPVVCPPPPAAPEPIVCPASPAFILPHPTSFTRRGFIGAGVFLGMTTTSETAIGPAISLGFVPFSRWPGLQIEFDGAYASRNVRQGFRVETVPVFVSLCHVHHGLRLCGGMASTLFFTEDPKNARDFMFSASLRIGTQFELAGPFSIRADVFALLPLTQPTALDARNSFAAGATVMGVWSFD